MSQAERPPPSPAAPGPGPVPASHSMDGQPPAAPAARRSEPVLILFAHPAFEASRINRALLAAIDGLADVDVVDLYELYPDFMIDVAAEQARLQAHRHIVLQHPFFWYSVPALLKEYFDIVLTRGFAYGPGAMLEGRSLMVAATTAGVEDAYRADGAHGHTIAELLRPQQLTARLCRMVWLPPFVTHGSTRLEGVGLDTAAERYRERIIALRDGRLSGLLPRGREPQPPGPPVMAGEHPGADGADQLHDPAVPAISAPAISALAPSAPAPAPSAPAAAPAVALGGSGLPQAGLAPPA